MSVWGSDGWQALLRGMRDNPNSDLHRLVAADYLEENGKAEYAEWVRLGVEYGGGSRDKALLARMHELAPMAAAELRVPYAEDDSRGTWRCSSVGLTPTPDREGTICHWNRGFVGTVRTTCRQWIDDSCPVCSVAAFDLLRPTDEPGECWKCQGTRKAPPLGAARLYNQPVLGVEFADCNPTVPYQRRSSRRWGFRWSWADSHIGGSHIPRELYENLMMSYHLKNEWATGWSGYESRADAEWDLSKAAIKWALKWLEQRGIA